MAERENLIAVLDRPMGVSSLQNAVSEIRNGVLEVEMLFSISLDCDNRSGFHAAWILEKLCEKFPEHSIGFVSELFARFGEIENPSTLRTYSRLLERLVKKARKGKIGQELGEKILSASPESLIERCFDCMINPKEKIGVRIACCDLVILYLDYEDWIKEEVENWLEILQMQNCPSALACARHVNRLLQSKDKS